MYKLNMLMIKIQAYYMLNKYKFWHWLFSWCVDTENDLVFSIAKRIHFIKYKEHTIIQFGKRDYAAAPKHVMK